MAIASSFHSIWQGNMRKVREARDQYAPNNPYSFFPFASALYSFRMFFWYRYALLRLLAEAGERQYKFIAENLKARPGFARFADQCDMLATYFVWASYLARPFDAVRYRDWTKKLCELGSQASMGYKNKPEFAHTWCLIRLTRAELMLLERCTEAAIAQLYAVGYLAGQEGAIGDVNQRVRIFVKLALLYQKAGRSEEAIAWKSFARTEPGSTWFVRAKAHAALWRIR